jgi:anti-sigma B factor antagonist
MVDLSISVEGQGSRRVVHLAGECDIATAPKLKEALDVLRPPEVSDLVVDVSELHFLDSTGLAVLIGSFKRIKEANGNFAISGAERTVRRVLEGSGLDRVIPMRPGTAET